MISGILITIINSFFGCHHTICVSPITKTQKYVIPAKPELKSCRMKKFLKKTRLTADETRDIRSKHLEIELTNRDG